MRKLAVRAPSLVSGLSASLYGPGLPIGGDYGTILAYFVNRNRPTYGFAGMPPSMAVVGVEAFLYGAGLVPLVYLFLDQSMVAESWYYVYRYLYGTAGAGSSVPSGAGPVSGSPGPLVLISSNLAGPTNNGFFNCELPKSAGAKPSGSASRLSPSKLAAIEQMGNPMLVQISLGNAPSRNVPGGGGGGGSIFNEGQGVLIGKVK